MYALEGFRILGGMVRGIIWVAKLAYKVGILPFVLVILLKYKVVFVSDHYGLFLALAFILFILHWVDFIFMRVSGTGERHILVYYAKKFTHKNIDIKGVISEKMAVGDKYPDAIILGRDNASKRYLQQTIEEPGSVAIIGQAGSGKSQAIASTLLSYGDSCQNLPLEDQPSICCVDVKGEFLKLTYDYRHEQLMRPVHYLSFGERILSDIEPSKYDLFNAFKYAENPIQAAQELSNAFIILRPDEKQPHFPNEARTLLAGLWYCMAREGLSFSKSIRLVCGTSIPNLIEDYCIKGRDLSDLVDDKGWMLLSSFYEKSKDGGTEEFNSVLSTMLSPLRMIAANDTIMSAFDVDGYHGHIITPEDLMTGDVFFCIREQFLDPDQPNILNVIISQFLSFFSRQANNTSKRCLFVLDEYTRLGKLPVIDGINLYRSKGLRFIVAMQSTSQICDTYGNNGLNKLMDGCDKTIVMSAKGESAEYFSRRVGEYEKTIKTTNRGNSAQTLQFGGGVNAGMSESQQLRKVFQPSFFESELVSNQKELILSTDGYRIADVCFAWNDPIISKRAKF